MKNYSLEYKKVMGKRNYVVKLWGIDKIASAMTRGEALKNRAYCENIWNALANDIQWVEFTYKKDWLNFIEILKEDGFKVCFE